MGAIGDTLPAAKATVLAVTKPERLISFDVFRGLTIVGMILATDPGSYSHVYRPLLHAGWNGWSLTDVICPSFPFIVITRGNSENTP